MYTAVIFDRDGVLTDFDMAAAAAYFKTIAPLSMEALSAHWLQWSEAVGFPRNLAEEADFWRGFWAQLVQEFELPPLVQTKLTQFDYAHFLRPYPDARPALLAARQHGLQTGVLSNFNLASLPHSLTAVGLAELVDVACAAPVIGVAKPEAEAYLTVTRALGVLPAQCLFFDDEAECVAGARRVGMRAFLVDRSRLQHDLEANIVSDLTILPQLIGADAPTSTKSC